MNTQPGPMEFLGAFAIVLGVGLLIGFVLAWCRNMSYRVRCATPAAPSR